MKILRYEHKGGWITRIVYRETMNDLVIIQYKKHYKKEGGEYREIYLYDDDKDIVEDFLLFLKDIKKSREKK